MTKRNQSPHYIPELDPENNDETDPDKTIRGLLLEWHTWLVLGIGVVPVLVGLFGHGFADWTRIKLVAIGIGLSLFLIVLFITTNRPKH